MDQSETDQSADRSGNPGEAGVTAIRFRPDPEAAALRAALWLGLAFVVLASVALAALWLDWAIAAGAIAATLGMLAAAAAALVAMPRPAAGDGLALDRDGLTLTRAGRQDRWHWRDLGDFTIETRSGLAGRLFGDQVVIRKADAGPNGSPRRRIAGSCLASPHEIAATVAAYRDHAAGRGTPDPAEALGSHARFHLADQGGRRDKTLTLAIAAVMGMFVVYGVAAAVGGMFDGWDAFVGYWTDPMSHRILLSVVIGWAGYDLWSWQRKLPATTNQLVFDARGLVIVSEGKRRCWRWDLVSEPEIHDLPEPENGKDRRILFIGRHDGLSRDGTVQPGLLPGAVRIAIDDLYDAPLETIAERFRAFRARAQSEAAVADPRHEPSPLPT